MDGDIQGRYFSITDQKDVNTVIYQVNKTEKKYAKNSPKYTIERLDYIEEMVGEYKKKTFFVENPLPTGNQLAIFSFGKEKVVVNVGILEDNRVRISKKPIPMKFEKLFSENESVYKEFKYTPNLKRPICIIDPTTTEELKPTLYFDEKTNEVKGKCKLKPNKSYFAFEIRDDKNEN